MLLAILLPFICSIIVGAIVGDVKIQKSSCPPHEWSYVHMSNKLECVHCSKRFYINEG